jgi:hypothetical protein
VKWLAAVFWTLLVLSLVPPGATAAGITLTAGQQDFYFLTGQRAEIPLMVTSTFTDEKPGTVRFSTDTQLEKTGTVMISTENRIFSHTVPAGRSFLNLTLSPSQVTRDSRVHVSYYYSNPAPVNVSLPEFYIHIVSEPGLVKNMPAPLTGTSRPETGTIPAESSVSIVEQAVSVREQMGSDSSGQPPAGGQSPAGSGAEREQQREREQREQEQAELDSRLAHDPLVIAVNRSLAAEGFSRCSLDTQPAGNDTGTFSMLYRRGSEDQVVVQGSMADGFVPSLRELANVPVTADPALDTNPTFQSFNRNLAGQAYIHKETLVRRTLSGAVANITYADAGGKKAYINATVEENRVIQVTLGQEPGPADGFLPAPLIMVLAVILAVSCWFIYGRYRQRSHETPDTRNGTQPAYDHRAEAEEILKEAGLAYERQDYARAYGLAGRALRMFLSYEYGEKGEVTADEAITLLRNVGHDTREIESVLGQCSDIVFARGVDAGEFSSLYNRVREIIQE